MDRHTDEGWREVAGGSCGGRGRREPGSCAGRGTPEGRGRPAAPTPTSSSPVPLLQEAPAPHFRAGKWGSGCCPGPVAACRAAPGALSRSCPRAPRLGAFPARGPRAPALAPRRPRRRLLGQIYRGVRTANENSASFTNVISIEGSFPISFHLSPRGAPSRAERVIRTRARLGQARPRKLGRMLHQGPSPRRRRPRGAPGCPLESPLWNNLALRLCAITAATDHAVTFRVSASSRAYSCQVCFASVMSTYYPAQRG